MRPRPKLLRNRAGEADELIEIYKCKAYWSPDMGRAEAQRMVFQSREASEAIRKSGPKWMKNILMSSGTNFHMKHAKNAVENYSWFSQVIIS